MPGNDQIVLQYLRDLSAGMSEIRSDIRDVYQKFDDHIGVHDQRISKIELARANENGERKAEIKAAAKRSGWISLVISAIIAAAAEAMFKK